MRDVEPGGLIVTGWGTPYHGASLLRLVVRDGDPADDDLTDDTADEDLAAHGKVADGCLVDVMPCEWLRSQRVSPALDIAECEAALARSSWTDLDINDIAADHSVAVAIGLRVPDCASVFVPPDDQWFVDPTTRSWARLHERPRAPHLVNQYGPRNLWDEIEGAHLWFVANGRPPAGAWRFTVTYEGTTATLPGEATA